MPLIFDPETGKQVKESEDLRTLTQRRQEQFISAEPEQKEGTPPPLDLRQIGDPRERALRAQRSESGLVRRGFRSGMAGLEAGVEGVEAIAKGLSAPVIGEEPALRAARKVQQTQQFASDIGPQANLQDVSSGRESFSNYLAGAVAQQVPNLAITIGASLVGGPLAGVSAGARATRLASATAGQAKSALTAGAARTGAARAALAQKQKLFKEALDAGATTVARQRSAETVAAARNLTAQQGAEQALRQEARNLLKNVIKRRDTAFVRGTEVGGVLTGSAAGSGVAAGESSSFILDPESDSTLVARSMAALFGAGAEGATNALPILGVLRNVGLGRTAGRLATQNLARAAGGSRTAAVSIGAAKQTVAEGAQEVSAEFLMNVAHRTINDNIKLLDDEALMTYLEAGVLGGIIGGGIGGATSIRIQRPGPNVTALQERQAEREQTRKQEEFEALDPEVKAQRSANPLDRMNVGATMSIARNVMQGTVAGRRAQATLEDGPLGELGIDAALALRTLIDPNVDIDTAVPTQRVNQSGQTEEGSASLGSKAYETAQRIFGDELGVALEIARQNLLGAERQELAFARANGLDEEAAKLEWRVNEIERLGSDELIEEAPAADVDLSEVDPEFVLPLQREVDFRDIAKANPINTPRFGPIFVSPRAATQQGRDNPATPAARIAEGMEGEVASVGEIAERIIRRDLGLEASETLNQNEEARTLFIREAQEINNKLPENSKNRREITNFEQAGQFLDQFDTVIQERLPSALRGSDELAFNDAEVRTAPERKKDAEGNFVNTGKRFVVERRAKDGKATEGQVAALTPEAAAAQRRFDEEADLTAEERTALEKAVEKGKVSVNLVNATKTMLGRINAKGTMQTNEASERAGRRAQEEGGGTGGFSRQDKATALLAAAADLRQRGFQFELEPDAIAFRGERTPRAEVKRINSEIEALQAERRSATPERAAELQQQIDELRSSIQRGQDQTVADITTNVSPELRRALAEFREAAQEPTGGVQQAAREVAAEAPRQPEIRGAEAARIDAKEKAKREERKAKQQQLTQLQERLQRVSDVADNISARKRSPGGTRALLRDLRQQIDGLDAQGDARRIEALQAVERFFQQPENQQQASLDTLKAKRAKLDEQVNATRAEIKKAEQFLRGTVLLRELNLLRGRPLFSESADAREKALLKEFAENEKLLSVEQTRETRRTLDGDIQIDEQATEFGEIVGNINKKLLPPWIEEALTAIPITAENLSEESTVLQSLADDLGLDTDIQVVDWIRFQELTGKDRKEMEQSDGLVHLSRNAEGRTSATIWVNEALGAGTDARGAALYHELGHAVLTASTFKATDAEVKAIWKSYRAWVRSTKDRTVSEALKSRRALLNMVNTRIDNTAQVKELKPGERRELLDFQEWFADQTARFMETSKAARQTAAKAAAKAEQGSVVRRFFSSLAERVQRVFRITGRNGYPVASVRSFLDRLMTAKGEARNVRQFDMWARIEEAGNALNTPNNAQAIDSLIDRLAQSGPASFAKAASVRAQRRLVQGAHEMATVPYSTEAFYATRDAVVAKLTPTERFVLGRAFNTPAVRRQLLDVLREAGAESEAFLSDPLNLIAAGYQIWLSDNLKLGPKAEAAFSSLSKYAAHLSGRVRTHEQAEQLLQAMAQNKINARRSRLFEAAQDGSHLNRGRYALDRGTLARVGEIQERFAKQKTPKLGDVREQLDKDRDLKRLPVKVRNWLAEDIAAKTFSEEFVESMTAHSDFTLDPSKQFELKRVLERKGPLASAANGIANLGKLLEQSNFGRLVLSEAQRARMVGNVAMESLLNDLYPDITTQGRLEAMLPRKTRRRSAFNNQYFDIVDDLNDTQQAELREALLQRTKATDPTVKQAERKMRALMKRLRTYAVKGGLEMGNIENYFPWVFDPLKVEKQRKQLMTRLAHKKYRADWEELARRRGHIDQTETLTDTLRNQMIRATLDKIVTLDGGLADTTERLNDPNPAPSVGALNKRELNFLWEKGDEGDRTLLSDIMSDDINGTMATYINQLVKRVEYVRTFGADGEKFQRRLDQARELGATDADVDLMQKMLQSAMGTIGLEVAPFWKKALEPINSGLKRAPVVTKKGHPFTSRTAAEKRLAKMKMGGTIIEVNGGYAIERDLTVNPRRFRQLQSALVVYQNFRLLSLAALTNVADAAGILARTGDAQIALEAYKVGLQEVMKSWNERKLTPTEKRRRRSEQRKLAEEMGAIEASVISDQLGQFYGSVFMDGAAKRYNDALFKWNGMEGLTRVTRLMAVTAGRRYLSNHAARAADGEAQSVDMLRAIDLEPRDVRLDDRGELVFLSQDQLNAMLDPMGLTTADVSTALEDTGRYTPEQLNVLREVVRDDRVKRALFRMADESVLRPAATQRPTWMNDPNWLVFSHLKGFMYTYHERVLRRAYTAAIEGNWAPAAYMLSYVPVIMAADLVRQLLQHGPEGDDRKERWGIGDYALDALHRSGIGGSFNYIPDMMKTHSLGKNPLVELGGTSVSFGNDWARSLLGNGSVTNTLKRTLPASQVLVDVPSAWTSYAFNDHIGQDNELGRLARASAISDMPLANQGLLGE